MKLQENDYNLFVSIKDQILSLSKKKDKENFLRELNLALNGQKVILPYSVQQGSVLTHSQKERRKIREPTETIIRPKTVRKIIFCLVTDNINSELTGHQLGLSALNLFVINFVKIVLCQRN